MATTPRLLSPAVSVIENDLSFLPQGINALGAAFIGPFDKGPAFIPTVVQDLTAFQAQFGNMDVNFYTPYAASFYLSQGINATIVRILGLGGYDPAVNQSIHLELTGTGSVTNAIVSRSLALIHPSQIGVALASASISGAPNNFILTLSGSSGIKTYASLSVDPTSTQYFARILGTGPTSPQDGYVYVTFPDANSVIAGSTVGSGSLSITANAGVTELNFSGSTVGGYSNAFTPMIRSQLIGNKRFDLFQAFTLSDGNAANPFVKISITNINPPVIAGNFGTFTLLVRDFNDTDTKVSVLESYDNLTLDPTDANFIARRIGNSVPTVDDDGDVFFDGDFTNNSQYIYIQMAVGSDVVPTDALPYAFAALSTPLNRNDVPAPDYVITRYFLPPNSSIPVANDRTYYGFDFSSNNSLAYINPLPSGSSQKVGVTTSGSADSGFDLLTSLTGSDSVDISVSTNQNLRKFTVPFQGGFDGQNPAVVRNTGANITSTNTMGFDLSSANSDGGKAYNMAIQSLANADAYDINLLVLPGVVYAEHPYVITQAINMVETRGDVFLILDPDVLGASAQEVVTDVQGLDTNFAGTYHPWVKILDTNVNRAIWVPPSTVMPAVYAFNDRVGGEFYAPAGLNRGGIPNALDLRTRLSQTDMDNLYVNRVNPIRFFAGQSITVWGQKTLQQLESALDRINVRRLMIKIEKFIASTSQFLLFEQINQATFNRFLGIVNPYLSTIQQQSGITAFKVIMDFTNNTPDTIDRNILIGTLFIQPTKAAEFIVLTFNITNTGASFTEQ